MDNQLLEQNLNDQILNDLQSGMQSSVQYIKTGAVSIQQKLADKLQKASQVEISKEEAKSWAKKIPGKIADSSKSTYVDLVIGAKNTFLDTSAVSMAKLAGVSIGVSAFRAMPKGMSNSIGKMMEKSGNKVADFYDGNRFADVAQESFDNMNYGSDVAVVPISVGLVGAKAGLLATAGTTAAIWLTATSVLILASNPEYFAQVGKNIQDISNHTDTDSKGGQEHIDNARKIAVQKTMLTLKNLSKGLRGGHTKLAYAQALDTPKGNISR